MTMVSNELKSVFLSSERLNNNLENTEDVSLKKRTRTISKAVLIMERALPHQYIKTIFHQKNFWDEESVDDDRRSAFDELIS